MRRLGVVLAAGLGERLRPITNYLPKPLMPMDDGRLIIQDSLDRLIQAGVEAIYVVVGYMGQVVEYEVSQLSKLYNIPIHVVNHGRLLGTAGHLYFLNGIVSRQDEVVVSNADVRIRANMADAVRLFEGKNLDALILAYKATLRLRFGVLEVEDGLVKAWREKPTLNFLVSAGSYIFRGWVFESLRGDFIDMDAFINSIAARGGRIGVFEVEGFEDIGTIDDYVKALCSGNTLKRG